MSLTSSLKACVLALAGLAGPVLAAPITINYSGAITSWTVATSGTYTVTAIGAQGGASRYFFTGNAGLSGGLGASITGTFDFTAGQIYTVAVGGEGSSSVSSINGGGGGGTFFVDAAGNPLLVAGGGGGIALNAGQNGCDASITAYATIGSGSSSTSTCALKSTGSGSGGSVSAAFSGAGGAGFFSNGVGDLGPSGGNDWANGLAADFYAYSLAAPCFSTGGFGGGGNGTGCGGGGGGGGYSGGDGGAIAGGGGSWNTGRDAIALAHAGIGNGSLTIDFVPAATTDVPEPATLALVGMALAAVGASRRRR